MNQIQIMGVLGLPIIQPGDDLPGMIAARIRFEDGDILAVASSVYSKSKGFVRTLKSISPTERAKRVAGLTGEDPRFVQAVLDASEEVLMEHPFILSALRFGPCRGKGRGGPEQYRGRHGHLPPSRPDGSRRRDDEHRVKRISGKSIGVIITDTCGRSFRRGQTGHAIGWAGMVAIRDFRGDTDLFGHVLKITEEAVVDEIAGFANYVMGESDNGVPAVVFRNCPPWEGHDNLYFKPDEDIFRKLLKKCDQ